MAKFSDRQLAREQAYANGNALKRHIDTVHDGKFDPNCKACAELKAKHDPR